MNIQHFDIKSPDITFTNNNYWIPTWYGYSRMAKCESKERLMLSVESDAKIKSIGYITEEDFERDCLLSILADIKKESINMFEIGAGYGRTCLSLAGTIDYEIIPVMPTNYRCLAVEGEPTHFAWLKSHFLEHNIKGETIFGAVSNKIGSCYFDISTPPEINYGQTIDPLLNKFHIPSINNIKKMITKKSQRIPQYTVDQLIKMYSFDSVDILNIDVQGYEYKVIEGSVDSIENNLIDYILIGTHNPTINDRISAKLKNKYELVVNIYPLTTANIKGLPPVSFQDGIQLYKTLH